MIPYTDLGYFGALAALALPILLLRGLGRDIRYWLLACSAVMIALQFCTSSHLVLSFLAFAVWQGAVAYGFLRFRATALVSSPRRRWGFYLAITLALLPLLLCRLLPYLAGNGAFGFLGISYVTFRSLDVIFGLDDGLIATLDAAQLFTFLFFFPPLSSGPIDRYRRFQKDWVANATRAPLLPDLDEAVRHLFRGLLYKFIIAYLVKKYWLDPAAAQTGLLGTASYMYAYSAFLFFDFAGYSAFAVGASYLFGIHTPENFHRPFLATNIKDFWTRWHISLSTWFRDHVYMRFVLTATKRKWFLRPQHASHVGYGLTFGLMGLWHGLAPNFLIYGFYHAALLIGYDLFKPWNQKHRLLGDGWFGKGVARFATFNAVCLGFLIFSGHIFLGPGTEHPKVKAGLHAATDVKKRPAHHPRKNRKVSGEISALRSLPTATT